MPSARAIRCNLHSLRSLRFTLLSLSPPVAALPARSACRRLRRECRRPCGRRRCCVGPAARPVCMRASLAARRCVPLPRHAPLHHAPHECIAGCAAPRADRSALPRALRTAVPAAQSPLRLRSAGFSGVDLPIPVQRQSGFRPAGAGLGFHTRRIVDAGCTMPSVVLAWPLMPPSFTLLSPPDLPE